MRVPDSLRISITNSTLSSTSERIQQYQTEVSSGLRILKPSDDPAGAQYAAMLRTNLTKIDQYQSTANDAQSWLKSEDVALSSISDTIQSIKNVALQAANPMATVTQGSLLKEISASVTTLQQSLNATDGSRYLFAGNKTQTVPFQGTAPATVTYAGDDGTRRITIGDGINLVLNHTGSEIANLNGASDAALPDIFTTINSLVTAIQTGDQQGITASLKDLDAHAGRITDIRADNGVRLDQTQLATDRLEQTKVTLNEQLSNTEDCDLTDVLVKLKEQENVMQAATYVASTIGQGGLLQWLK